MLNNFRGAVDHSPRGDRRIQGVLRGRFLFADMAFFKIECFYSFNVEVTGAARLLRVASSDRRERGRPPC